MNTAVQTSRCRVAIAGFGTVGQAVARILASDLHPSLQLTHVCNRAVSRKMVDWVPSDVVWTETFEDLLDGSADVVVEVIGGVSPAREWMEQALAAGMAVVTANKQVIAHHGASLGRSARAAARPLLFEAAVAGGVPIVRSLREGIAGDRLHRIQGVLNGTCNYILTRMEREGVSFEDVLADAQRLGYAEADPTADVDGFDAQAKLAILVEVGLGCRVDVTDISVRSIRPVSAIDFSYAKRLGCVIRQVARAELLAGGGQIRATVQPALVPEDSSLARVDGSQNIVVVDGEFGGETAFSGFGAGGNPTAVAVVSDLLAIASGAPRRENQSTPPTRPTVQQEFDAPHYIRFMIRDRPGIIAALAEVFSRHGINVDAVWQEPGWSKTELPFVMTLETCGSASVTAALDEISQFDFHVRPPLWLPILTMGEARA